MKSSKFGLSSRLLVQRFKDIEFRIYSFTVVMEKPNKSGFNVLIVLIVANSNLSFDDLLSDDLVGIFQMVAVCLKFLHTTVKPLNEWHRPVKSISMSLGLVLLKSWKLILGRIGPVVARSTSDWEVPASNPTLADREFLWAQEMSLGSPTRLRFGLLPWVGGVCATLIFLSTICWLRTKPWVKSFPRETRALVSKCSPMTKRS